MKLYEILYECEECYVDEENNIINEAAIRQMKRQGSKLTRKYRCKGGPKDGKIVAEPGKCGQRKDPKKVRTGRKVMRSKKGLIKRKSLQSKRKAISRLVTKMNRKLAGK